MTLYVYRDGFCILLLCIGEEDFKVRGALKSQKGKLMQKLIKN